MWRGRRCWWGGGFPRGRHERWYSSRRRVLVRSRQKKRLRAAKRDAGGEFARILSEGNVCGGVEFGTGIICRRGTGSGGAQSAADLFCRRGGRAGDAVCHAGGGVAAHRHGMAWE